MEHAEEERVDKKNDLKKNTHTFWNDANGPPTKMSSVVDFFFQQIFFSFFSGRSRKKKGETAELLTDEKSSFFLPFFFVSDSSSFPFFFCCDSILFVPWKMVDVWGCVRPLFHGLRRKVEATKKTVPPKKNNPTVFYSFKKKEMSFFLLKSVSEPIEIRSSIVKRVFIIS